MLHSAPSFSVFVPTDDEAGDHHQEEEEGSRAGDALRRTLTIGDGIQTVGSGDFSFGKKKMGLIDEQDEQEEEGGQGSGDDEEGREELGFGNDSGGGDGLDRQAPSPRMYLAAGLGIEGAGFGGASDGGLGLNLREFDGVGDEEEYYERMVNEFPCHPMFLRNYARLLQTKGDLHGAEDYSYRATLAEPEDGEILAQYAKIVWELYHDKQRALTYYERAVDAAANDSQVLAAYAGFLWELEDENVIDGVQEIHLQKQGNLDEKEVSTSKKEKAVGIPTAGFDIANFTASGTDGKNIEEIYKQMIEEDPSNPLILKSYAQFLYQVKQDLQGAEVYYSRAILADPIDSETLAMYAKLVWQLHRDHDKASSYFEQAVQANPTDSHILAAYVSFLWETENDDDEKGNDSILPNTVSIKETISSASS